MDDHDPITRKALFRYQVISAYLALDPARGQRRLMLEQLAAKTWMLQSGEVFTVKAETIRYWLRMYRLGGFEALKDKPRSDRGIRAIPQDLIEQACKLKLQVPERSIEQPHVLQLERNRLQRYGRLDGLRRRGCRVARDDGGRADQRDEDENDTCDPAFSHGKAP